ncbi:MAG: EAL domain-containing protein [Cyanobacteria bacterium P01_F01_bin.86]
MAIAEEISHVSSKPDRHFMYQYIDQATHVSSNAYPAQSLSNYKNILVVDDSPDNLRLLSLVLAQNNYDVRCAKNGKMAFRAIAIEVPDLILLDIRMPGLDGYRICQQLKANPDTQAIPVIFISGLDSAFDKVKAFTSGGVDYITKPFQVEEVLARVKNQLERQSFQARLDQLNNELEQRVALRTQQLQTLNQRLRESEKRLESILNTLEDIVWSASFEPFQILYLNPAAEAIYQRPVDDFLMNSRLWFEAVHPDDRAEVWESVKAITSRGSLDIEYRILRPNGEARWVRNRSQLVIPNDSASMRIEGIISDISDRKRAEQRLMHDALHDALTQLPNRTLFSERIEHSLQRQKRNSNYQFAVLFIDLDRFKIVNDSLGHSAGDRLLIEVADRLLTCIRPADTIARLGGDEFTILLDEITDTADVIGCVERIQAELDLPINLAGNTVFTGASIGVVIATTAYNAASDLLRDADIAMYRAKETRKSGYELFNQEMYAQTMRRLQLENKLRVGLEHREFQLYYQPIISLADRRILGFEALVRWQHPEEGIIYPDEFIAIAEETGLILPIGNWILEQACCQIAEWQKRYDSYRHLKINVNVASQQIREPGLFSVLDAILQTVELSENSLRLEITEGTLMQQTEETIKTLKQIRQRHVQISIDDFGTGYSSLSYLSRFPINNLKIDRSFVGQMHLDPDSFEIVRTITALAHTLGMDVTAEGIEQAEQLGHLKDLRCEFGQGYLFSSPLEVSAAENFLMTWPH